MKEHKPASGAVRKPVARAKATPAAAPGGGGAIQDSGLRVGSREEMVREIAFCLYEARGCLDGHALEDWLHAEAQVEQTLVASPRRAKAPGPSAQA